MSDEQREEFHRRYCGFIFQGYDLFPALTARQHVEMMLRWGEGVSSHIARERAEQTLARLCLAGKADLRPCDLSGGERQRVAVARALVKNPSVVFADEPTAALDWGNGKRVVELLRGAADLAGATVLVVGHDPRLIEYADRVLHLDNGRIRFSEAEAEAIIDDVHGRDGTVTADRRPGLRARR
jgi:putative ABC transport system ATP-binding protein